MGKDKKTTQTSNQQQSGTQYGNQSGWQQGGFNNAQFLDAGSQDYVNWLRGLGQGGSAAALGSGGTVGPNEGMMAALQKMGGSSDFSGLLSGLSGQMNQLMDPATLSKMIGTYMNLYTSGVVDPTRAEFDHLRGLATREANQAATAAGAFGSARHGVAEATRKAALDRAQGSEIANLMKGGYDTALNAAMQDRQQRAQGLGSLGAGVGNLSAQEQARQQQLFQNYDYLRQISQSQGQDDIGRYAAALGFANQGMGPTGWNTSGTQFGNTSQSQSGGYTGSSTGKQTNVEKGNFLNDALGLALTFGPMFFGLPPMPGMMGGGGGGGQQMPAMRGGYA